MTEKRKQELRQLINEAMENLEIRPRFGNKASSIPVNVYQKHLLERWTFYSERAIGTLEFLPYIVNCNTKSQLLNFIKLELASFIYNDQILPASFFLLGGPPDGYPLDDLLTQLLKIAIVRGTENAVSALDRCTEDTHGSFQYIALLDGIRPKSEIQVCKGIRLVPLPHPPLKLPHYLPDLSNAFGVSADSTYGKTLLIIDHSVYPIFHKPFGQTTLEGLRDLNRRTFQVEVNIEKFPNSDVADFSGTLFCRALSLACNCSVVFILGWQFLGEDQLFNLKGNSVSGMNGVTGYYHSPWQNPTEVNKTQMDDVKCLYEMLVKLDSETMDIKGLWIAIDRWQKSKIDPDSINKMIDLGIAFESLYVPAKVPGKSRKIVHNLKKNASRYLGKNKNDQEKLEKKFKVIYDCRCDAVHEGRLKEKIEIEKDKYVPQSEFITEAQDLCRQSILKVLKDGKSPNWNNLILGEESL